MLGCLPSQPQPRGHRPRSFLWHGSGVHLLPAVPLDTQEHRGPRLAWPDMGQRDRTPASTAQQAQPQLCAYLGASNCMAGPGTGRGQVQGRSSEPAGGGHGSSFAWHRGAGRQEGREYGRAFWWPPARKWRALPRQRLPRPLRARPTAWLIIGAVARPSTGTSREEPPQPQSQRPRGPSRGRSASSV